MSRFRTIRAEGSPRERGRRVGEGLRDLIERSLAFYRVYFERRGLSAGEVEALVDPYVRAARDALPERVATIGGMAEGAGVPFPALFAVNAFEELERRMRPAATAAERCSTFAVSGPGFSLLGHNEQWFAGDAGNVAVVIEHPAGGGVRVASPTVACCLPAVGMNASAAQGIESLAAFDDRVGIPRVLVSRHSLEARDRRDAVRRAALPGRAGGYAHVFSFVRDAPVAIETTATRSAVLAPPTAHTNHYLDPELADFGDPPSPGSLARQQRLLELLSERSPDSPEGVMDVLRDHGSHPQAICLHPDEDAPYPEESSAVVFSMVCDVAAGRMWVAGGNPCDVEYEEVDLSDVVV